MILTALAVGKYKWRRLMRSLLASKHMCSRHGYIQRWQVETVVSMIKRNLSEALTARSYHARNREMSLRALVHNIMLLFFGDGCERRLKNGALGGDRRSVEKNAAPKTLTS